MALRSGAAAAIACIARERATPFLFSKSPRLHHFPSHSLQRFTSHLNHQQNQIRAIQEATANPLNPKKEYDQKKEQPSPENWKIKMLYDGDCPLCMREVMGRIHAILSDGTVVTDVEAFRRLYEQVGLGWVYAITKYEPIATIADAVYGFWAKYRLQVTGK
ncbi:hypothetical protein Dsin_005244 [Dipteronia sinensis]|uniref:Uncharacterized protein n=1 Tax=Dipteronia sinensis TaxID=43782 RepID=A0AAE0EF11_9ROSI|nr:hypothetical protein Dsin_005244 [Dipteronia sinensis]